MSKLIFAVQNCGPTLILGGVFASALLVTAPAKAALDEAFLKSCAANAGSMPIDATSPRVPLSFASNIGFTAPTHIQGVGSPTCADLAWVKVPTRASSIISLFGSGKYPFSVVNAGWAGRVAKTGGDCAHSLVMWGLYRKNLLGTTFTYVGGGMSFGDWISSNMTCVYDKWSPNAAPAGFGGPSITDSGGSTGGEYRIAFYAWSHNDKNIGHPGTDCSDPVHCNWPMSFQLTGVRPVQQNDVTTWRATDGTWRVNDQAGAITQQWGGLGDSPVYGDWDNDGTSDFAVWRPSNATYYVINSSTGNWWQYSLGLSTDWPVPADYSGDGATDIAVRRDSSWFYIDSRTGNFNQTFIWGGSGGFPVRGNFDGDLKDDFAWYDTSSGSGIWNVSLANGSGWSSYFGTNADIAVSGDFNGDRMSDMAVWRGSNGMWSWVDSSTGSSQEMQWGAQGDIPVPGRYDGDAATDFVVFRPSEARFYVLSSKTGAWSSTAWGMDGDIPTLANRGAQ